METLNGYERRIGKIFLWKAPAPLVGEWNRYNIINIIAGNQDGNDDGV